MAECSEISLLLGAFEDGELEPNEMQDVAYHLARCERCTGTLGDFTTIARGLRDIAPEPMLGGFAAAVVARIDALPQPPWARISRFFGGKDRILSAGFAWGTAAAAVAAITMVLTTPYARRYAAERPRPAASAVSHEIAKVEQDAASMAEQIDARGESRAVISRLEAEIPSVAVWSEPRSDTTVIWLPDQP
ncbi:MAG: zf-HC2 domain-containing protein [Candidatus Binatus sp.]|uniref:anti-sigma factor family protein n=1 Tax=Candidatus Binatus sp. TaxID=2811406 RepID=UPI00271C720E|nr:zf-HC2 domain-containing protein [Candidatus Binatus sp.]MDO8430793.1 zf-HC2 domain-containing protein [Candidatus Binatus sp.]